MFKDPIKDKPKKNNGVPYDERSSVFVDMGTTHGVGYNNPIGHSGDAKKLASTLPQESMAMKVNGRG